MKNDIQDSLNPYIALSDLVIALVLIVIFFVALGRLGLVNFRYKHSMEEFAKAVQQQIPPRSRPRWDMGRNDPPGVQRWVFDSSTLFLPELPGANNDKPRLSPEGEHILSQFAALLIKMRKEWRRIRVEGHTRPPFQNEQDDWDLSARRAAIVVNYLSQHIPSWFFAVAGRAGQNPLYSAIVLSYGKDPRGIALKRILYENRVSFTSRDLTKNVNLSDEIRPYLSQIRKIKQPSIMELIAENLPKIFSANDSNNLKQLIANFHKNERVEIVIEYTRQGTNNISSP